jgi:hypothetical protein
MGALVASPPHNACNRNSDDLGIKAAKLHLARVASITLAYPSHIIASTTTISLHERAFATKCAFHGPCLLFHRGFAILMCLVITSGIEASGGLRLL